MTENTAMLTSLIGLLRSKGLRISFAESLTGGMISSGIVDISGASDVFDGAVVCYTNDVKMNVLNVEREVIDEYTEVSAQCARQMAYGVRTLLKSDISVSVTGYADGQQGGTVYIGFATKDENDSYLMHFKGNRNEIRRATSLEAYSLIRKKAEAL